ncbi:hypothetical protein ABZ016_13955 [Streptomyces sp. NPDC006372]|uniref:hypothetical protein n=1 Tax=Streptomyces sp. NPDC006372 TaxID=3155599 RepID=UPI0033BAADD4
MAGRVQDLLREWAETELLPMQVQQTERKAVSLGDSVYRLAWEPGKMWPVLRVHDPGFSPPTRRCSVRRHPHRRAGAVLPADAGVLRYRSSRRAG